MKARGKVQYFQQREKWSISDLIFNPMVKINIFFVNLKI